MRKIKCNKKRQCGLDKVPPVMDSSNQFGEGSGLNVSTPDYLIPLKKGKKIGKSVKIYRKQRGGGRRRPTLRIKSKTKGSGSPKTRKKRKSSVLKKRKRTNFK